MDFLLKFSSCTDVGQVRSINQDAEGHKILEHGEIFVVCDGIGGYAGGEIASKLAVKAILDYFPLSIVQYQPAKALKDSIFLANREIVTYKVKNPHVRDMGTTIVVLYIFQGKAYYAHVGDSRLYYFHKNKLRQMTKDHSLVQELVDDGVITEEMALKHPSRNLITRGLGTSNHNPDVGKAIKISYGDKFLICTDGLTNSIRDSEIVAYIKNEDMQYACQSLISEANMNGGDDNITVQLINVNRPLG
jgi:PPM family protein phosphatase